MITRRGNAIRMKNVVHPGRVVRRDCLEPLGLSVTEGVSALGVTRRAIKNESKIKVGRQYLEEDLRAG